MRQNTLDTNSDDKKNRHSVVDSGDSSDGLVAVPTITVTVKYSYMNNPVIIIIEVNKDITHWVLGKDNAQALVKTLKLGSEFANTLVKLEPEGHPFYDFLT